ncbi:hypothetical protein HY971_03400 [Candidatus Kaiserbacteria bacterium]|nr:hypothetical protein [Candidatus Kaiserbacteria bacterium]
MEKQLRPQQRIIPARSVPGNTHSAEHRGMNIDVYRLIHLAENVAAEEMAISNLLPQMGDFCWTDELGKITPEFVVQILREEGFERSTSRYPSLSHHIHQIQIADYSFPIILYQGSIIDGMHRLAKAVIENQTAIKVKNLQEIPQEALMQKEP